jgi:dTDP-4-dehydrorhamnose reductase
MKILVIGRSGQLARSLAAAGARFPELALEFVGRPEIDLCVAGSTAALIDERSPELIINCAAFTAVDEAEGKADEAFQVNARAPGEIGLAAARAGAGLIHVSTDYVFDGSSADAYDEGAPTNPVNVYGHSKLAGERAIAESGATHAIVRTSWLVSPYGHNFVRTMLRLADERDEIAVVADQVGRPTEAGDLAEALLAMAASWAKVRPGVFHVAGGGEPASWADVAELVMARRRAHGGRSTTIRRIASAGYPTAAVRPQRSVLDCRKAERELAIALPDWRRSLAALADRLVGAGA